MSLLRVALAAAVMAIGAVINGGCYLGSILYLGRGKSNLLFSPLGIALAARADVRTDWFFALELPDSDALIPDPAVISSFGFMVEPKSPANPLGLQVGFAEGEPPATRDKSAMAARPSASTAWVPWPTSCASWVP